MFGIGIPELMLIMVIALIVLGPERMPRVARDLGKVVGDLRRTSDELREEFLNADKLVNRAADVAAAQSATARVVNMQKPPIGSGGAPLHKSRLYVRERLAHSGRSGATPVA